MENYDATRDRLQRAGWKCETPGADGLGHWRNRGRRLALIHSVAVEDDGELWDHVSVSRADRTMPTWEQLRDVFHEVCGDEALGVVVIPPTSEHVNIHEVAHAWRRLTGSRPLPDFTHGGATI